MRELTAAQQDAVIYNDGDSAILAGAGSGKTFVIVEKTATLIDRWHVPPEKILVVTFTDKAAEEVKERIDKRLRVGAHPKEGLLRGGHAPEQGVTVSTVHGFAADILRLEGAGLGLSADFRILNEFLADLEKARSVREKALELIAAENPEILEAVGRFGFRRALGFFLDLMSEPDQRRSGTPFPETLRSLEEHYRARKSALNSLDFDDLEKLLLKLAREHPASFSKRFSWIIVDEFQDTNPIQWEIVSELRKICPARLVIVGDPRQSIYRFRGADPSLFLKVSDSLAASGGRTIELSDNFRSRSEVVAFVNAVSETLFPKFPLMKATRTDAPGHVERLFLPDDGTLTEFRVAEAQAVAGRLKSLRESGELWKSMAVLFKTRKAVADYEKAFKETGIPYRTSLGEPLLERPEILSLLFWMQRKAEGPGKENAFLDTALKHSALNDFRQEVAADPLSAFLDQLFEAVTPLFPDSLHLNLKSFRSLLNDLMSLGVGHLKALVDAVKDLREDGARIQCPNTIDERQDAVTIMTVHGAKGLEWPTVVLGDLKAGPVRPPSLYLASEDGELLLKDGDGSASGLKNKLVKSEAFQERESREREEALEESKRLLYVALTRARDRLILPLPTPKSGGEKGKDRRSSRWSDWLSL